jgi:PTS system beta-glucosides-specific IIC component
MVSNKTLVQDILDAAGGTSNIRSVTHCATRLRLTVNDPAKTKDEQSIKKINGVLGMVMRNDEYQIIIGPGVEAVYLDFLKLGEFKQASADDDVQGATEKTKKGLRSLLLKAIDFISGSFVPVLPIIVAGGLISAILVVCTTFFGMSTESGMYIVLNAIYKAAFTFLPIYVGYNTAKKLNVTPMLGALLGGVFVTGSISGVKGLDFLGIPITAVDYGSSVLPVVFGVLFMSAIYHPFEKRIPKSIKFFVVPTITMIITVPVALIAIGPLATWIGSYIAIGLAWLHANLGWFSVGVMGGLAPVLIFSGTGTALYPAIFLSFTENGYEGFVMTGLLAGNLAVAGAAIATSMLLKNKESKSVAMSTGITASFGITEPAIFGVLTKFKRPFIGAIIGGTIAGLFAGLMQVVEYSFSSPGIASVIAFINPDGTLFNFFMAIITMVIAFVGGFVATRILGVDEDTLIEK